MVSMDISSTKDFLVLGLYAHRKESIQQVHIHDCSVWLIKTGYDGMIKCFSGTMTDCIDLYKQILPHLDM